MMLATPNIILGISFVGLLGSLVIANSTKISMYDSFSNYLMITQITDYLYFISFYALINSNSRTLSVAVTNKRTLLRIEKQLSAFWVLVI